MLFFSTSDIKWFTTLFKLTFDETYVTSYYLEGEGEFFVLYFSANIRDIRRNVPQMLDFLFDEISV